MRTISRDIVGAFLISKDKHILLGHVGVYKGKLAVPGGGIEPGESEDEAVIREIGEETGIDIRNEKRTKCSDYHEGESDKVLRDTGETVHVTMRFIDYVVYLNKFSNELPSGGLDDFKDAQWYPISSLDKLELTAPSKKRLIKLGYLSV